MALAHSESISVLAPSCSLPTADEVCIELPVTRAAGIQSRHQHRGLLLADACSTVCTHRCGWGRHQAPGPVAACARAATPALAASSAAGQPPLPGRLLPQALRDTRHPCRHCSHAGV